ncbi:peptidylprolyl isomerase [Spirosoma soli]|uniref:Peptidyl-prolyl cis-trans isomerase n=1 Tax=Spirosoma soli TaxID=1770529 RepID=A0ABW5LXR8_9BACT
MVISKHKAAGIGYRLHDETGQLLESRDAMTPLYYLQGEGLLLEGVEDALEGRQKGDRFSVTISPENRYGERDSSLVEEVLHKSPGNQPLEPGTQLHGSIEQVATITE